MKAEGQHQEVQSRTIKPVLQKYPQEAYMVNNRNTPQMQLMDMIQRTELKTPQVVDNIDNPQIRLMKAIQRMGMEDEEELQMKPITQLQSEDEELQMKPVAQLQSKDEELLQGKLETIQQKPNNTGLPDNLKSSVENMSGFSMDDVRVHYNSDKPALIQAHAYAQGTDIHVASGQERHLPHEAWHVVQQKQGRVQPTMQMQGVSVNNDDSLESEADMMGSAAMMKNNKGDIVQKMGVQSSCIQMGRGGKTKKHQPQPQHSKSKRLSPAEQAARQQAAEQRAAAKKATAEQRAAEERQEAQERVAKKAKKDRKKQAAMVRAATEQAATKRDAQAVLAHANGRCEYYRRHGGNRGAWAGSDQFGDCPTNYSPVASNIVKALCSMAEKGEIAWRVESSITTGKLALHRDTPREVFIYHL